MARWACLRVVLFVLVAAFLPMAQAGSQDDPEVVDDANDVSRYPGVPTADPTVDLLGIWFTEEPDAVLVHLEVAQVGGDLPEVSNVNGGESYAVNVFVDGENEGDDRCSGWGDFGVSWYLGEPTANLRQGWHYDGEACPADDVGIPVSVVANVITWTVPKGNLAMLLAGSELTVARAEAWSGDTWPATPGDDADNLPGRVFVVQTVPAQAAGNATSEPLATAVDTDGPNLAGEPSTKDPGTDSKDAPAVPFGLVVAALVAGLLRRRA